MFIELPLTSLGPESLVGAIGVGRHREHVAGVKGTGGPDRETNKVGVGRLHVCELLREATF